MLRRIMYYCALTVLWMGPVIFVSCARTHLEYDEFGSIRQGRYLFFGQDVFCDDETVFSGMNLWCMVPDGRGCAVHSWPGITHKDHRDRNGEDLEAQFCRGDVQTPYPVRYIQKTRIEGNRIRRDVGHRGKWDPVPRIYQYDIILQKASFGAVTECLIDGKLVKLPAEPGEELLAENVKKIQINPEDPERNFTFECDRGMRIKDMRKTWPQGTFKIEILLKPEAEQEMATIYITLPDAARTGFTKTAIRRSQDGYPVVFQQKIPSTGSWHCPHIPVQPLEYYKLTFESKSSGPSYWAAVFFDETGKELVTDDHCSLLRQYDEWTRSEFYFRSKFSAATVQLRIQPHHPAVVQVRNIKLETATHQDVLNWCDRIYATLPSINYAPSADRWEHIPETIRRLNEGEKLRIVFLGDSIANDIGSSPFELLVGQHYRQNRIEVICSVRSATGCDYYQHENRVQDYVVRYNPDLVIIAGISHGTPEAIRRVIQQIKEQCDAEILVMSGAFAPTNMALLDNFHENLRSIAVSENVEFFNIRGIWIEYAERAAASGVGNYANGCNEYFMRDGTHPNEYGRQVIARVIAQYFSPK